MFAGTTPLARLLTLVVCENAGYDKELALPDRSTGCGDFAVSAGSCCAVVFGVVATVKIVSTLSLDRRNQPSTPCDVDDAPEIVDEDV